jgi:glycosyltransferase involved in cell wall biosynthesis
MSSAKPATSIKEFINLLNERPEKFYNDIPSFNPIVSIISSFFNAHQCFEETYQSITNQTFQNFEWIIVDDCSTNPEAISLFNSLPLRSRKIKTFRHELNKGLAAGRNTAIHHAAGKYLFFMDLDDLLDQTYIEKCVLFLETNPEFSMVNSYSVGFQEQEYWWEQGLTKPNQLFKQNCVSAMLMYRKRDFDKLGGFDENLRFYEDWERWLRAIANNQKGWTIPEYLHCYRRTTSGLLSTSRLYLSKERQVTELIKSRYQISLSNKFFPEVTLRKACSFDFNQMDLQINIKNKLGRKRNAKRILFLLHWLEVGGVDKFNIELLTLLKTRGYDLTIATTLKSEHPWHQHFYKITPDIFHLSSFLDNNCWLAFIRYIITSRQIDIVFISHSFIAYYLLPLLRYLLPDVAFVDFVHTYDPALPGKGHCRTSCKFSQFLDCQIVSSHKLASLYQINGCELQDKIRICYINVDTQKWTFDLEKRNQVRTSLGIDRNQVVLLFPARIEPQKRPLFLVDILKKLVAQSLPITVISLGQGSLLPEMQAKIKKFNLDSIFHTLNPVAPEEMINFYSAADIMLLPSEYEGIALAIYEAMSMQLAVVASDVGGQDELVTPETGFLVPKGNGDEKEVEEYLKVLVPLIKNASLRQKVGFSARQRVAELFSLEIMGDRIETIFTEAIKLRKFIPQPETNLAVIEEMLVLALEYSHLQEEIDELGKRKQAMESSLQEEIDELGKRKQAMESSKFWKLRKIWLYLKRFLKITDELE